MINELYKKMRKSFADYAYTMSLKYESDESKERRLNHMIEELEGMLEMENNNKIRESIQETTKELNEELAVLQKASLTEVRGRK